MLEFLTCRVYFRFYCRKPEYQIFPDTLYIRVPSWGRKSLESRAFIERKNRSHYPRLSAPGHPTRTNRDSTHTTSVHIQGRRHFSRAMEHDIQRSRVTSARAVAHLRPPSHPHGHLRSGRELLRLRT